MSFALKNISLDDDLSEPPQNGGRFSIIGTVGNDREWVFEMEADMHSTNYIRTVEGNLLLINWSRGNGMQKTMSWSRLNLPWKGRRLWVSTSPCGSLQVKATSLETYLGTDRDKEGSPASKCEAKYP